MSRPSKAAARAAKLREELEHHGELYYTRGQPEISDAEYDALYRDLVELEAAHPELVTPSSPTRRVGAPLPEGESFEKVRHAEPMLSIDSLFGEEEVREFEERIVRFLGLESGEALTWSVEPKFDGVSAALIYEGGVFVRGVTRGDGQLGEDVTANLKTVRNVPMELKGPRGELPGLLEVRGEVLIATERFERYNRERVERGLEPLANPRNATSGAIRRNDPAEVANYPLEFHAYSAPRVEGHDFTTQTELNEQLARWGIPFSGHAARVRGLDACLAYHDDLEARRDSLPFEVDGVVAKLDDLALRGRLGRTSRAHRWQYAHKFAPREATTTLRAIETSVGTNGRLTPRAHVDPVEVGGVTVRHATLHNVEYVAALGAHVGDRVFVRRAGDVIPQITGVARAATGRAPKGWREGIPESLLDEQAEVRSGVAWQYRAEFEPPEACPACGTEAAQEGKYWRCPNTYGCRPQVIGRTWSLAGRKAFEIDRIGEKQIAQLFDAGLLEGPADLFFLDCDPELRGRLLELERWGEKSVDNLFAQIEERRTVPFDRFLVGLSVPEVGPATARLLADRFDSLEALRAASVEELIELDGIGEEVAAQIDGWFAEPRNVDFLERLLTGGVRIEALAPRASEGPFAGKTVVFTGTLTSMTRAEAKQRVEAGGGRVASSVSAKTDFLIVGGKPGSKAKKAEELGVSVLLEDAFRERIDG